MAKKPDYSFDPEDKHFAIIYGDGSADNNGKIGSGFTGYIYNKNSIGASSGDIPPKYYITETGYVEAEQMPLVIQDGIKTVVPCMYFEGLFGRTDTSASDRAELLAFINSMNCLINSSYNFNFEKIIYKTDSAYVVIAINHLTTKGELAIGQELKSNKDLIKQILQIIEYCKSKEIVLEVIKVQGHSTSLGNNIADRLAKVARVSGCFNIFNLVENNKHWSKSDAPHPMIGFRQLFFINSDDNSGKNLYSVMNYKTSVETGRKTHDALFGLVNMIDPIQKIDSVMTTFNSFVDPLSLLSTLDLSVLFNRDTSYYYDIVSDGCFYFNRKNNSLMNLFGDVVARTVYPPGLANQAYENMNSLHQLINRYKSWKAGKPEDKITQFIDITDKFYEVTPKGKYNCILPNGTANLDLELEVYGKKHKFPLSLGIDTLTRNSFKQMEADEPKVFLIAYQSFLVIEYCTLVETKKGDIGVYCNPYSCKIFLK